MDTLTSFLLNEDSALPFDSFNEAVLQNLPHEAEQWGILDPIVPFGNPPQYTGAKDAGGPQLCCKYICYGVHRRMSRQNAPPSSAPRFLWMP
jgi:hypothetical protein